MADTSSLRGVERTSTSRASGVIIEAPVPCRKREPTKVSSEKELAQQIEPAMKTRIAQRNTLRAPSRSAIQPDSGMNMASATK